MNFGQCRRGKDTEDNDDNYQFDEGKAPLFLIHDIYISLNPLTTPMLHRSQEFDSTSNNVTSGIYPTCFRGVIRSLSGADESGGGRLVAVLKAWCSKT